MAAPRVREMVRVVRMTDALLAVRARAGACAEEDWQLVRGGAAVAALQREVSPIVVLQRSVYAEKVQLLGGRFEALGTNAEDDGDDEDEDEIAAKVDGPNFRFSQRKGLNAGPGE